MMQAKENLKEDEIMMMMKMLDQRLIWVLKIRWETWRKWRETERRLRQRQVTIEAHHQQSQSAAKNSDIWRWYQKELTQKGKPKKRLQRVLSQWSFSLRSHDKSRT
jgi:hypothetical protein